MSLQMPADGIFRTVRSPSVRMSALFIPSGQCTNTKRTGQGQVAFHVGKRLEPGLTVWQPTLEIAHKQRSIGDCEFDFTPALFVQTIAIASLQNEDGYPLHWQPGRRWE